MRVNIQVFGTRKCTATRAALRFFAERRIKVHFVDLTVRPAARGELTRFAQRFGVPALLDRAGRRFGELGLGVAQYADARWLERLEAEPLLLRTPLVRHGNELTIGLDEAAWRRWVGVNSDR